MSKKLEIKNLNRNFWIRNEEVAVLKDIHLTIDEGEFIAIVGHSGCGKSTLLKIIAGLEVQSSGSCLINGRSVSGTGPDRGMIFQEHRLFPWLKIKDNVQIGLDHLTKQEKDRLADDYLAMMKLSDFKHAYPSQLSGGMSQRVAIARALVTQPDILLLDEPFGALDALTKMDLQTEMTQIRQQQKSTMIMVTHDIEEAVFLADKVVVLSSRPGTIQDIVTIELGSVRDRGSADFAWYKRRILNYLIGEAKVNTPEFTI
ncbi:MAG: ABC transporter ATP-binding protein [Defluviitaleaceae bacterium]|nr:ABC transporter ATP-binding protein [Defluviitaleaceae bacterium]